MKDFAERLTIYRRRAGLTQKQLSERSGIHYAQISKYENGDNIPTIATLEWLCKSLGVSSKDLLGF